MSLPSTTKDGYWLGNSPHFLCKSSKGLQRPGEAISVGGGRKATFLAFIKRLVQRGRKTAFNVIPQSLS